MIRILIGVRSPLIQEWALNYRAEDPSPGFDRGLYRLLVRNRP